MKSILLLIVSVLLVLFSGCSEEELQNPKAHYTLTSKTENGTIVLTEPYIVNVGQSINFTNDGSADYYSFFSGMPGSVWTDYINPDDTTNEGFDTTATGDISFIYTAAGDYTATMVLTNRKMKNPYESKQVTINFAIKVIVPGS